MNRGLYGLTRRSLRGGLTLLEEKTAVSSATLNFTQWYRERFDQYALELLHLVPATDNVTLVMRVSVDGGATYAAGASDYWHASYIWQTSAAGQVGLTAASEIPLTWLRESDNSALYGFCGSYKLFSPGSTSVYKRVNGQGSWLRDTGPALSGGAIAAAYLSTTPINGLQFLFNAGAIASGTVRIYGVGR